MSIEVPVGSVLESISPIIESIMQDGGGFHISSNRLNGKRETIRLIISLTKNGPTDEQVDEINKRICEYCDCHDIKGRGNKPLVMVVRKRRKNRIDLVWD